MGKRSSPFPTAGLVLIRLVCGLLFVTHAWGWLAGEGMQGADVRAAVDDALVQGRTVIEWWGRDVLLSNPDAIAFLCKWMALLAGISLLLGALVRPLSVFTAFFLLNGWMFGPDEQRLLFFVLAVSCLACAIGRAGRRFGVDKALDQHLPGWATWTPQGSRSFLD